MGTDKNEGRSDLLYTYDYESDDGGTIAYAFDDTERMQADLESGRITAEEFWSPNTEGAISAMNWIAESGWEPVDLNGIQLCIVSNSAGRGSTYVPDMDNPGVEVLASAYAGVQPDSALGTASSAHEVLLCLDDLYWHVAYFGDVDVGRVVGCFDNREDGLAATVKASMTFHQYEDGSIWSEINR